MSKTPVTLRVAQLLAIKAQNLRYEASEIYDMESRLEPCESLAYAKAWQRIHPLVERENERQRNLPPCDFDQNQGPVSIMRDLRLTSPGKEPVNYIMPDGFIRRCAAAYYAKHPNLIPGDADKSEWLKCGRMSAVHADKIAAFMTGRFHDESRETDRIRKRVVALSKIPFPAFDQIWSAIVIVDICELRR